MKKLTTDYTDHLDYLSSKRIRRKHTDYLSLDRSLMERGLGNCLGRPIHGYHNNAVILICLYLEQVKYTIHRESGKYIITIDG